jgi:hypothetical protein
MAPAINLGLMAAPNIPPSVKALAQELVNGWQFATDESTSVVTMKVKTGTVDAMLADLSKMQSAFGGAPTAPPAPDATAQPPQQPNAQPKGPRTPPRRGRPGKS